MKILIELPSWLGDAVMTTPAIKNLINHYDEVEITIVGSLVSIEVLKNHPKVVKTHILDKKNIYLYYFFKSFQQFDVFFSFRSSIRTKLMKFFIKSKKKYQFDKNKFWKGHQVEKYNNFINSSLNIQSSPGKLNVYSEGRLISKKNKLLGINPGASYGSAKQWYPEKFAEVACKLSKEYDIIIFGGRDEEYIASEIERYLVQYGIDNYNNLAGKTSINELCDQIKNLDLFITGDSGPMHLAAAYEIPTVSIFGPTNFKETSQWMNLKSKVVKKNLNCQPCMKRSCPLGHHNCMRKIEVHEVLNAAKSVN
jgi:heptosyltransferase II